MIRGDTMMADRGLKLAFTAIGLSVLFTSGALADEIWQRYAPRCQPTELALRQGMSNPCEQQFAVFGLNGPQMLSHNDAVDVEATGSIKSESRQDTHEGTRAPM